MPGTRSIGLAVAVASVLLAGAVAQAAPYGRRTRPLVVSPYLTRSGYLNGTGVTGRRTGTMRRPNFGRNRAGAARPGGANQRMTRLKPGKTSNFKRDVPVGFMTDLDSLNYRHTQLAAQLPTDLRRLDSRAFTVVLGLPRVVQYAYLRTVEDYRTLSPNDQLQLGKVIKGLADLGPREGAFIEAASPAFTALENSSDLQLPSASGWHQTCFKLLGELDRLGAAH